MIPWLRTTDLDGKIVSEILGDIVIDKVIGFLKFNPFTP